MRENSDETGMRIESVSEDPITNLNWMTPSNTPDDETPDALPEMMHNLIIAERARRLLSAGRIFLRQAADAVGPSRY